MARSCCGDLKYACLRPKAGIMEGVSLHQCIYDRAPRTEPDVRQSLVERTRLLLPLGLPAWRVSINKTPAVDGESSERETGERTRLAGWRFGPGSLPA